MKCCEALILGAAGGGIRAEFPCYTDVCTFNPVVVFLICKDPKVSSDSTHQFQLIFKLRALISRLKSIWANLAPTNLPLEHPLNTFA